MNDLKIIILAAGLGTRMASLRSKVLHEVAGKSLLWHVMQQASKCNPCEMIVVLNPQHKDVMLQANSWAQEYSWNVKIVYQEQQLGTAHAVLCAKDSIDNFDGKVLVLCGDTPLIQSQSLNAILDSLDENHLCLGAMDVFEEHSYGRVRINDDGHVESIVEAKNACGDDLQITLCNSGIIAGRAASLLKLLSMVKPNAVSKEYYLTDVFELAFREKLASSAVVLDHADVLGVNTRVDLAQAEFLMQQRLRVKAMLDGATLIDPETVYLRVDTKLNKDVVIEPHVRFGDDVLIGQGSLIKSFCYLEGVQTAAGVTVGPFAHIRPGTLLGADVKIGNFVELKQTKVGPKSKISHLSYVGDATLGADVNVGAGTITCNYDGHQKHATVLDDGVFVGSNTALVAPVHVGKSAVIGAGSVINKDVSPESLAVSRVKQTEILNWASTQQKKRVKSS